MDKKQKPKKPKTSLKKILTPTLVFVLALSLTTNLLALILPRVTSDFVNKVFKKEASLDQFVFVFLGISFLILIVSITQTIVANAFTEKFAANRRQLLIKKISELSYNTVNKITSSKLLTNLTSDIEAVKTLYNQGIVSLFSSLVLLLGASIFMLSINWQLALIVIAVIPALLISFGIIFSRIGKLFKVSQENIDKLNKVINESIVGSALIRVLNSAKWENEKFENINEITKKNSLKIVNGFASLIPLITILSNLAVLAVVYYGGSSVIDFFKSNGVDGLSPGDYAAFFSYVGTFIGPVILLGFISSTIARSIASINRIQETLDIKETEKQGDVKKEIKGDIQFKNVSLVKDNRSVLKDISFEIKPRTKNAIVGPTAAGKSLIFNLLAGLEVPESGEILIDGTNLKDFNNGSFYSQMGLVFQDNVIFNTTIKENILFNKANNEENLEKAIETAELKDFIDAQEEGLETLISERGSSLSGGQKQRLSLARALTLNPKILLLDDFTARVDIKTERNILANIKNNYPEVTLLSISQKIESIKDYDQIFLIMEGELLARGTHEELLKNSFEYQQIYNSQQSTE